MSTEVILILITVVAVGGYWGMYKYFGVPPTEHHDVTLEDIEIPPIEIPTFEPKLDAAGVLQAIVDAHPNDKVEFTHYPLASGLRKLTATFASGDSLVGVGATTYDAACVLASRLGVKL
jgi:hypothetical protein